MSEPMNKQESCNMMRDLMPLCIDATASEDSHRAVSRHLSECDDCLKYYREMQADMARPIPAPAPKKEIDAAMRQMKRKRWMRIIAIVLAVAIALSAVMGAVNWLRNDKIPEHPDNYSAELYVNNGHAVFKFHNYTEDKQIVDLNFSREDSIAYLTIFTVRWPERVAYANTTSNAFDLVWSEDTFVYRDGFGGLVPVEAIVLGNGAANSDVVLWEQGNPRPHPLPEEPVEFPEGAAPLMPFVTPAPTLTPKDASAIVSVMTPTPMPTADDADVLPTVTPMITPMPTPTPTPEGLNG